MGTRRRALLTGLSGQDGSFLAELLLEYGYEVIGMIRPGSAGRLGSSEHLRGQVLLVEGDLLDPPSLRQAVAGTQPDELYHLAAPSFVPDSWRQPAQTVAAIAGATATLLEAVRDHSAQTRVFLATSSTIFGATSESPQTAASPCRPESPYAVAKLAGHQLLAQLRAHDGLFACSGILYNHESERRPTFFVSRKITSAAAAIKLGRRIDVALGDLDAIRDWSFAGDVMRAAWLMLQHEEPQDLILASGIPHTVRDLAEVAFAHVGLSAEDHVRIDGELVRSPEPTPLVGDATRAREVLGWKPSLSFEELVHRMVDADLRSLGRPGS